MSSKKQTDLLRFMRPNSTKKATKVDSQSEVRQSLRKDISEAATVSLPKETSKSREMQSKNARRCQQRAT